MPSHVSGKSTTLAGKFSGTITQLYKGEKYAYGETAVMTSYICYSKSKRGL